ncbi:MAG: sugar transferase [Bacteroidales bacterium]|nr:sugar transferase [Bacteroidales bacterium]
MYKSIIKPTLDFTLALIGLIILSPIFILITVCLTIANNGKPFFFQKRPGKNEKIFSIIKFKSMNDRKDAQGNLLPDAQRLTKIGSFVRKTSIDELPQLFNILKGDMSFIGPRPLAVKYLPYYSETEKLRHTVKPGITGLAQVSGRNSINWDKKLEIDVHYVKNISFKMDLTIFFKTIYKIIASKDISESGVDSPGDFDVYRKNQTNEYKGQ